MAKVPTYGIDRVQEQGIGNVALPGRASAASFGGTQAQQLGQLGQAGSKFAGYMEQEALRQQETVNRTKVLNQTNKAREEMREYMAQLSTKKGEAGVNAVAETKTQIEELQKRMKADLKNPAQQELFDGAFASLSESWKGAAWKHQTREVEVNRVEGLQAANMAEIDDAVANRQNLNALALHEKMIVANTQNIHRGKKAEVIAAHVAEATNDYHLRVAEAIRGDSPQAAKEYLKKVHEADKAANANRKNKHWRVDPLSYEKTMEKLEPLEREEKGRAAAQQLVSMDRETAEKELRKIKDAGQAEETRRWLNRYRREDAIVEQLKYEKMREDFFKEFEKNPQLKVPEDLKLEDRKQAYKMRDAVIKAAKKGYAGDVETDPVRYEQLITAAAVDPQGFAKIDQTKHYHKLGKAERKELAKLKADILGGKSIPETKVVNWLQDALTEKGENSDKKSRLFVRYKKAVNKLLSDMPEAQRNDPQRVKAVVAGVLVDGEWENDTGWWNVWDENTTAGEALLDRKQHSTDKFVPHEKPDGLGESAQWRGWRWVSGSGKEYDAFGEEL